MQIGHLIEKYRVIEPIGSGAFSEVFLAQEEMTGRKVAMKGLRKIDYPPNRMKFLLTEFQAMSKISGHRNIVSLYTVEPGADDYIAWIVMEYVEGKSLHDLMQEGALSLTDTLNIGLDICRGLKEAHAHKIMHRDIKPENILLTADRDAKIIDFSVARIFSETTEFAQTVVGTRSYMAPEQHYGSYDYCSDLYNTGITLFLAVTGQFPFSGEHNEIEEKKAAGEIEEIDRSPEVLHNFFQKALHPQLSERHQSAAEMHDELNCILQDEYVKQVSKLINTSVNSSNPKLAETLERHRKTFRLPLEVAERINQNLFFERRQKEENSKHENTTLPPAANPANPTVEEEEIAAPIQKLPDKEPGVLSSPLLERQELTSEETESDILTSIRTQVRESDAYKILNGQISPELLLAQVHTDIQYPHEEEALHIFQEIQSDQQQKPMQQCHARYKQLGEILPKTGC